MPISGGASDKLGNSYEALWTAFCMIKILDNKYTSICLEPIGEEGEGIEFWLDNHGQKEYHQVKRQITSEGRWTISLLNDKKILGNFKAKLNTAPQASCHFVSTHAAYQLEELSNRARAAGTCQIFMDSFLNPSKTKKDSKGFKTVTDEKVKDTQEEKIEAATNNLQKRKTEKAIEGSTDKSQIKKYFTEFKTVLKIDSDEETFNYLKRIFIYTISETILNDLATALISNLIKGEATACIRFFKDLIPLNVHKELTAFDLFTVMEKENSFTLLNQLYNVRINKEIEKTNAKYIDKIKEKAIFGRFFQREEVSQILDYFDFSNLDSDTLPEQNQEVQTKKQGIILAANGGFGKSSVLSQVAEQANQVGIPFLCLRLDRLRKGYQPVDIGQALFGIRQSPVEILANIACGRPCLLVIDQLDAISRLAIADDKPYEDVSELISEVKNHSNMRLLLACRHYDLDGDERFKKLIEGENSIAQKLLLNSLSAQKVKQVILQLGLSDEDLTAKQIELLRIPLHLGLLTELFAKPYYINKIDTLNFSVVKDLYTKYWEEKQRILESKNVTEKDLNDVVALVAREMSKEQRLIIPASKLRNYRVITRLLVSENILIKTDESYAFFHENFFDYIYAYNFLATEQSLLQFLLESGQNFFRRSQVKQILLQKRDTKEYKDSYLEDLRSVLYNPTVTFPIKQAIYDMLHNLSDPFQEEWELLAQAITSKVAPIDLDKGQILRVLLGSASWFNLLDNLGYIEKWLSDSNYINLAIKCIARVIDEVDAERCAVLLAKYFEYTPEWFKHLASILVDSTLHNLARSKTLFERVLKVSQNKNLETLDSTFWQVLTFFSEYHSEAISEFVGSCFMRWLDFLQNCPMSEDESYTQYNDNTEDATKRKNFIVKILHHQTSLVHGELLESCAENAPATFARNILPFVVNVIKLTLIESDDRRDMAWPYVPRESGFYNSDVILITLELALSHLAVNNPDAFRDIICQFQLTEMNYLTIRHILVNSYVANIESFADEAIRYLCSHPKSLELGYGDNARFLTIQLLRFGTPLCTLNTFELLEEVVLSYEGEGEKQKRFQTSQYIFLENIAAFDTRLSPASQKRLLELRAKLGKYDYEEDIQSSTEVEFIGFFSPVSIEEAKNFTDSDWQNILAKYAFKSNRIAEDGSFISGAIELSLVLQEVTKAEPQRFLDLALNLSKESADPCYFGAILKGLRWSDIREVSVENLKVFLDRINEQSVSLDAHTVCELLIEVATYVKFYPKELIELLFYYATQHPEPSRLDFYKGDEEHLMNDDEDKLIILGGTTVRGKAVNCLAIMLFANPNLVPEFLKFIELLVVDENIPTRALVINILQAVLKYDYSLGIQLFFQLIEGHEILLGTTTVRSFLLQIVNTHFQQLEISLLRTMLSSRHKRLLRNGTILTTYAAFLFNDAQYLDKHLEGSELQRQTLAEVLVEKALVSNYKQFCISYLIKLFNDENSGVQKVASKIFQQIRKSKMEIGDYSNLVGEFLQSPAFEYNSRELLIVCMSDDDSIIAPEEMVCDICERFLQVVESKPRSVESFEIYLLKKLVIKTHEKTRDKVIEQRCRNLLADMGKKGIYGIDSYYKSYDRD